MKICSGCKLSQPITCFSKNKTQKDGYRLTCKNCDKNYRLKTKQQAKIYNKNYRIEHKEKLREQKNFYYITNKDQIIDKIKKYQFNNLDIKAYQKIYRQKNKEKSKVYKRNYKRERCKTDINFKLTCNLRTRLNNAIKNNFKTGSAVKDLGCSIQELKKYLEKQFKPGMSWANWSKFGWHIDHIKPLASFDLTERKELLEAVHYTNLQPLWAEDNLVKADK